jgi:hypothetical protein
MKHPAYAIGLAVLCALLEPALPARAQQPPGAGQLPAAPLPPHIDAGQMQQLMEQAREMQSCMARVSPAQMTALQRKGEEMAAAIDALCSAGKRDEARERAIAYGKEMALAPELLEMRRCGESVRAMLPNFLPADPDGTVAGGHVCDRR